MEKEGAMQTERIRPDLVRVTVQIGNFTMERLVRVGPGDEGGDSTADAPARPPGAETREETVLAVPAYSSSIGG